MIELEERGNIALLNMAHGKVNLMDVEFCNAVTKHFEMLETSSFQAVILTGKGKAFSAGVDLSRALDEGTSYMDVFFPAMLRMFEKVFFFPKPVLAAINGHAIAGGCVLACGTDYRIMADGGGKIGIPELLVGVPFPTIALEIMRFNALPQHFHGLVYGGTTYSVQDAAHLGLINEIVSSPDLISHAIKTAEKMATIPVATFQITKKQMRLPIMERVKAAQADIGPVVQKLWSSPEILDAIRRYVSQALKKTKDGS
ncbi:MAG: enoyl-CoA hydratase/isomerase family protein [SAR324 cluster bacterium]|nr:enoyl-CoA hydratase/isomerase family protein [SAR324 cluster bacterium]